MNKLFAILFIFLIFGIASRDAVVYTQFKFNQDFIATVFCINKNKPTLKCNGKCYLKKKIAINHNEDAQIPLPEKERTTINLYFIQKVNYTSLIHKKLSPISYFKQSIPFLATNKLFRPPDAIFHFS